MEVTAEGFEEEGEEHLEVEAEVILTVGCGSKEQKEYQSFKLTLIRWVW